VRRCGAWRARVTAVALDLRSGSSPFSFQQRFAAPGFGHDTGPNHPIRLRAAPFIEPANEPLVKQVSSHSRVQREPLSEVVRNVADYEKGVQKYGSEGCATPGLRKPSKLLADSRRFPDHASSLSKLATNQAITGRRRFAACLGTPLAREVWRTRSSLNVRPGNQEPRKASSVNFLTHFDASETDCITVSPRMERSPLSARLQSGQRSAGGR
jgi:hypothetical protein